MLLSILRLQGGSASSGFLFYRAAQGKPCSTGTKDTPSGEQLSPSSSSPREGGGFLCTPEVLTSASLYEAIDFHSASKFH